MEEAGQKEQNKNLPVILAVDDDKLMLRMVETMLDGIAQVITGGNTNEAEELMRRHQPALVLLDDMMPGGISGLQFLEKIKDDPEISKIPIIMVTARDKPEEVVRGLTAGAVDYIAKPFQPAALKAAVTKRLTRRGNRICLALCDERVARVLSQRLVDLACEVLHCEPDDFLVEKMEQENLAVVVVDTLETLFTARKGQRTPSGLRPGAYAIVALLEEKTMTLGEEHIAYHSPEATVQDILHSIGRFLKNRL
ncbi:MAG: response regulator [Proteobacteria bacterium]|jgi:DNA-binding response OmpR family regulator|nr:response regulator [Alphaproteobacteria bacterium]NCC03812.1 response regulator [Pseudomonadota bacterium]